MNDGIRLEIVIPAGAGIVFGKKRLKALMRKAGGEIAAVARSLIRRGVGHGRHYRGGGGGKYRGYKPGAYVASSPGEPPVNVTGMLADSLKVRPFRNGEGVAIRDVAFYAKFLETGAHGGGRKKGARGKAATASGRVLLPRPFLSAAVEQRSASLAARIKGAVISDIEFRRLRA